MQQRLSNCGGLIWLLRLQTDIIPKQLYELLVLSLAKMKLSENMSEDRLFNRCTLITIISSWSTTLQW